MAERAMGRVFLESWRYLVFYIWYCWFCLLGYLVTLYYLQNWHIIRGDSLWVIHNWNCMKFSCIISANTITALNYRLNLVIWKRHMILSWTRWTQYSPSDSGMWCWNSSSWSMCGVVLEWLWCHFPSSPALAVKVNKYSESLIHISSRNLYHSTFVTEFLKF